MAPQLSFFLKYMRFCPFLCLILALIFVTSVKQANAQDIDNSYRGAIAWSSNNQLAISSSRGMWVYDVDTATHSLIGTCEEQSNVPAFSQDDRLLAYRTGEQSTRELYIYDLNAQEERFSVPVEDELAAGLRFNGDGSRLAYINIQPDWVHPITTVPLIDIVQQLAASELDFQIPMGQRIEWADDSQVLWMLGEDAGVAVYYLNAVDTTTGEIIFQFPWFGNYYESMDDGTVFSFGAAQLVNNFAVFYVPIEPYLSPGFVIYDLRGDLEGLNRMGPGRGANFDDINRGLVIPYAPLSDLFTLNRQIRTLALVERDTPDQFRLLNIDSQETSPAVSADRRISELQFSPDGTLLAVRTTSERRDEVHTELWDIASLARMTVLEVSQWQASECGETTGRVAP